MKILITGASGLIGRALSHALTQKGHELYALVRKPKQENLFFKETFVWNAEDHPNPEWIQAFKDNGPYDALIHLAGESVANHRWTPPYKKKIYESRVHGTRHLLSLFREPFCPKVILSASAVGFYGDKGETLLTEDSPAGLGFLSQVCEDWEHTVFDCPLRCRKVVFRIGAVLSKDGGILKKLFPIFSWGLGSVLGSGQQWMSWIHIEDLVNLFLDALQNPEYSGAINACTPHPVTNQEFTRELARSLHKKALFKAPAFVLKLLVGELSELFLSSQRVIPARATALGFQFKAPQLSNALKKEVERRNRS